MTDIELARRDVTSLEVLAAPPTIRSEDSAPTCQNVDSEPSQHLGRASAIPHVLSQATSRKSRSTRHFSGGVQLVLDAIGACTTRLTNKSSQT
jgi:hypothetical protein